MQVQGIDMQIFLTVFVTVAVFCAPAKGSYCDLVDPPPGSNLFDVHGKVFAIFPLSSSIDEEFSGCQFEWAFYEKNWIKFARKKIIRGQVVRIDYFDTKPLRSCRYSAGRLVGRDDQCPSFEQARPRESSMSWNCLEWTANDTVHVRGCGDCR
jgi:hypothetical protein